MKRNLKTQNSSGPQMYFLMKELFPICRSITGDGVRESMRILRKHIPLTVHEVPSSTKVLDWVVPDEWNIKDAYIKNSRGERVVDFKKNNLHVLNYSTAIRAKMSLKELKPHLFTLPDHPKWIPYLTSYYKKNWGFCLSQDQLDRLPEDHYEVLIDSEHKKGSLTYGELLIKGKSKEEVLFTCYTCHPSLCNDNLSGVVVAASLAKSLLKKKLNVSYRFLFIPETIGAITWLSRNEKGLDRVKAGLVLTCVGDRGSITYKKSRRGESRVDKVVQRVLEQRQKPFKVREFFPMGSDERQFCSPGFDLPVGSLIRSVYGEFPEYHTSADDLNFISEDSLAETLEICQDIVAQFEKEEYFVNLSPKGEPQLGRRGLYGNIGGQKKAKIDQTAILWVLNLSDGQNSLLDIATRSGLDIQAIRYAAKMLVKHGLLGRT